MTPPRRQPRRHPRFTIDDSDDGDSTPEVVVSPPGDGPDRNGCGDGGHQLREKSSSEDGGRKDRHKKGSSAGDESYPPPTSPDKKENKEAPPPPAKKSRSLPPSLAWIPPRLNWKGLRPVVRSAVAAWCGLLLMLGTRSESFLGQASFLVLIVAIIAPAADPIATTIEATVLQAFFVALGWAWSCLGLLIAHKSRVQYQYSEAEFDAIAAARHAGMGLTAAEISSAISEDIFHGVWLENQSSAVCGIFLGVGGGFFLWLRGHLGPGPALFGIIFGIIMQAISLSIGVLFPYPYYGIGLVFYLPFICQLAIRLAVIFFIFPETLAHQFSDRLVATLVPLQRTIQKAKGMLAANPRTEEWLEYKSIRTDVNAATAGLTLLAASETNLTREISYARVSGKDLTKILGLMRVLVSRSTGFVSFYQIVEKHLHRDFSDAKGGPVADALVIHLGNSRPTSPDHTPSSTRPPSLANEPEDGQDTDDEGDGPSRSARVSFDVTPIAPSPIRASFVRSASQPIGSVVDQHDLSPLREERSLEAAVGVVEEMHQGHHSTSHHRKRSASRHRHGHRAHGSSSHLSLNSLLHEVLHPNIDIRPVGVVESQRYMDLEDYLHNPRDEQHIEEIISLLSTASLDLLEALDASVTHLITVIHSFKSFNSTWRATFGREDVAAHTAATAETARVLEVLETAFTAYKDTKRLDVVRPFACLFDPLAPKYLDGPLEAPSHRGLFWAFSFQFSLLGWSEALITVFKETANIEKKRRKLRVWTPDWAKFRWGNGPSDVPFADEAPTTVPGFEKSVAGFKRSAFSSARHPDYVAPSSRLHLFGIWIYSFTQIFSRPDFWFGVKASALIVLVSLPAYFQSTSYFFYKQRGVWVLIMAALTSTQYVGDTTFGFVVRVFGTFGGALVGMVIWYIGAGTGKGNPYGIAATMAVALPFIMFFRLYYTPVPSAILPSVTCMLVLGYSWQDSHQPSLSSVGWGWDVAWRRFVCVLIGITAAWIWTYVPPKSTQKETVRQTYATVIGETGGVLCQVLSFANCKTDGAKAPKQILKNISALRAKVMKTTAGKAMIRYEISLRGAWPAWNYDAMQTLQLEILDLLGQLLGVIASLDSKWTKALMHRAQLSEPRFLGEVLDAFQLIASSLVDSKPLPMIYNPLLELFIRPAETVRAGKPYGYAVTMDTAIEGIPSVVDLDTICSVEYLRFSCGISQCYAIINRLDRLMFVAKSLLGEHYIVYGLEPEHEERNPLTRHQQWMGDESTRNSFESVV